MGSSSATGKNRAWIPTVASSSLLFFCCCAGTHGQQTGCFSSGTLPMIILLELAIVAHSCQQDRGFTQAYGFWQLVLPVSDRSLSTGRSRCPTLLRRTQRASGMVRRPSGYWPSSSAPRPQPLAARTPSSPPGPGSGPAPACPRSIATPM